MSTTDLLCDQCYAPLDPVLDGDSPTCSECSDNVGWDDEDRAFESARERGDL